MASTQPFQFTLLASTFAKSRVQTPPPPVTKKKKKKFCVEQMEIWAMALNETLHEFLIGLY